MCTVAVDHEDNDLISYNRQCLHAYYASIRLLCQSSPLYTKEMSTHSNFQWAFKHIMPYSSQYSNAVQELNKCVQLFVHQKVVPVKNANSEVSSGNKSKRTVEKKAVTPSGSATSGDEVAGEESKEAEGSKDEETVNESDENEEEDEENEEAIALQQIVSNFKETLANTFLMNQDIDTKQSWQSIIMVSGG